MKKALFIIASSLCLLAMPGCKKETESFAHLLNEKVWTGMLHYQSYYEAEPFSVKFSTDGSFSWHEKKEDVKGTWKLDGPRLELNFSDGKQLKAELGADSTMKNFIGDDASGLMIVESQLNTNADMNLDDIRWLIFGSIDKLEFYGSTIRYYQFGFHETDNYRFTRQNGTMRVSDYYDKAFFVIMPDGETIWMNGNFGKGILKKPN